MTELQRAPLHSGAVVGCGGRLGGLNVLNQPLMESQSDGLQTAVNLQLSQDILDVIPNGGGTDEETLADGRCALALGQMAEDGKFPAAQRQRLFVCFILRAAGAGLKRKARNRLR